MFAPSPAVRIAGSVFSWLLFATAITLLYNVSVVVLGLGGSCASGGPYVIETQCPDGVGLLAPMSIFLGLGAVAMGLALARGFGPALELLSWPILFVGLGIAFLLAGIGGGGDGAAYLIAGLFVVMGAAPLIWAVKVSGLRMLLGSRSAAGVDFTAAENRRATPFRDTRSWRFPDGAQRRAPRAADWLVSLCILAIASGAGLWLGLLWFGAATGRS